MRRAGGYPWGKWALLGMATSAAVMAMGTDEGRTVEVVEPVKSQQAVAADPAPAVVAIAEDGREFERLLQRKLQAAEHGETAAVGNAFNATSWYVPPPPPPPAPPPPPSAPPLPFTYLGQYHEAGASTIIILAKADLVYTVTQGDVIDGTYSIGMAASGLLEFTYLPLGIKQSLNIGGVI